MFAVIKTGGRQYRVTADQTLTIGRVAGEVGDIVQIGNVLAHGEGENVTLGAPLVSGASVAAEILEQGRGPKVIAFKKRRRQNSRRKRGYRDLQTTVRISEILFDGAKPSKKATGKAAKPADASADSAVATDAAPAAETKAAPLFKAPKGEPDDLAVIKGNRPRRGRAAQGAGHHHLRAGRQAVRQGHREDRREHAVQRRADPRLARAGERAREEVSGLERARRRAY